MLRGDENSEEESSRSSVPQNLSQCPINILSAFLNQLCPDDKDILNFRAGQGIDLSTLLRTDHHTLRYSLFKLENTQLLSLLKSSYLLETNSKSSKDDR